MNHKLNCVLVIDDDEPTNYLTRTILEDSGIVKHIITVQSGPEALEYLTMSEKAGNGDTHPSPDLVFLDINMPAMNGWEFMDEYKGMSIATRIIIVMLTTSLFPEDRMKAQNMPEISGFENKPLTEEKLLNVVDKYFMRTLL